MRKWEEEKRAENRRNVSYKEEEVQQCVRTKVKVQEMEVEKANTCYSRREREREREVGIIEDKGGRTNLDRCNVKNSLHACSYSSNLTKERQSCEKCVSHWSLCLALCPYCAWVTAFLMLTVYVIHVMVHPQNMHICRDCPTVQSMLCTLSA